MRTCQKRATGQVYAVKMIPLGNVSMVQGNPYVQRECELSMALDHVSLLTSSISILLTSTAGAYCQSFPSIP